MINQIQSVTGAAGISPVEQRRKESQERVEGPPEDENRNQPVDRVELSTPSRELSGAEPEYDKPDSVSEADKNTAAEGWYRYGLAQAYKALEP